MKSRIQPIVIALLFISLGFIKDEKKVRFEIRKDNPAIGLTLVWSLPEVQLQSIIGDKFKPFVKDGKGVLMLFITTAKKYYLDSVGYDNLKMAHILVLTEGKNALNAPLSIGVEKQNLNEVLKRNNFKLEIGKVDMNLNYKNDSISLKAHIITLKGKIELDAIFPNKPGELKTIESTVVSATGNPNNIFTGPESYIPINIESIKINSTGQNWISQLKLPAKPDRIGMNDAFVWNFMFMKKK
ncbi:MAG: hypothetical protein PSX36_04510 [bacterium]|nr:hypothetical protein [bacterium]